MKYSRSFPARISALTLVACAIALSNSNLPAADAKTGKEGALLSQRRFSTPDEAVKALQTAAQAQDRAAMDEIFGPQFHELLTGDKVLDASHARKFAAVMSESCRQVQEGADKITLEIGNNEWPLPIPLIKEDGQWYFDTAAGKDEIINRHIGKDELVAIGVCRAYVDAQKKFAAMNSNGEKSYAVKFKSSPGRKDGLYWPAADNETTSPFGPLVAEAHLEGYGGNQGHGPHPFHGYYFRILTRQGDAAPNGRMNYLTHGKLTGGFALVAYPEHWDQSGIMTFIVNQDGKVYQKNLGEKTIPIAKSLREYNPATGWKLVEDQGLMDAPAEK